MIGSYAFSLQGASHVSADVPCQDASAALMLQDNIWVAVVADGLGSASRSADGSLCAVTTVVSTLSGVLSKGEPFDFSEAPVLLEYAFSKALIRIQDMANSEALPLAAFDTTLTACLFDGENLAYGQVGDGGAVALCSDGLYRQVTTAQKGDAANQTVPLRGRAWWKFDMFEYKVISVALMTDGIYDVVCPSVLSNQAQPIYVAFIRPFLDNSLTHLNTAEDFEHMGNRAKSFIDGLPGSQISDDKSIAVLMNTDVLPPIQSYPYYEVPDFKALHDERSRKLYKGLSEDTESKASVDSDKEFPDVKEKSPSEEVDDFKEGVDSETLDGCGEDLQ